MSEPWTKIVVGALAGAAWNGASLWCFAQLVQAWVGPRPSRRRAIGWLLVKFPVLYAMIFLMLWSGRVSWVGFSVGFSIVLVAAIGWLWWNTTFRNSRISSAC